MEGFSDFSANERTYLAWIRTSLAVMAFGFLIERFELFFRVFISQIKPNYPIHISRSVVAVGLSMMLVSMVMIILSTIRYLQFRKRIFFTLNISTHYSSALATSLSVFLVIASGLLLLYMFLRVVPGV